MYRPSESRSAPMSERSLHLITEQQSPETLRGDLMRIREDLRNLDRQSASANMFACGGLVAISGWFASRIFGRLQDRSAGTIAAGLCSVGILAIVANNAAVTNDNLRKQYTTVPLHYTGWYPYLPWVDKKH